MRSRYYQQYNTENDEMSNRGEKVKRCFIIKVMKIIAIVISLILIASTVIVDIMTNGEEAQKGSAFIKAKREASESKNKSMPDTIIVFSGSNDSINKLSGSKISNIIAVHFAVNNKKTYIFPIKKDLLVRDCDTNSLRKLSSTYSIKRPNSAMININNVTGLNVKSYIVMNEKTLIHLIDVIDEITVNVKESEISELNEKGNDIAKRQNCVYDNISAPGIQALTAVQATAYAELDHNSDNHFHAVSAQIIKHLRICSLSDLIKAKNVLVKYGRCKISRNDYNDYGAILRVYKLKRLKAYPYNFIRSFVNGDSCIVAETYTSNAKKLHKLFKQKKYKPSKTLESLDN